MPSLPALLVPHARNPLRSVGALSVLIEREANGLWLRYRLDADLSQLRLPSAERPAPADRLWAHTCFEAFIAGCDEEGRPLAGYREFNFSPSGQWAAYAFGRYRERLDWRVPVAPRLNIALRADALRLEAYLPAVLLPGKGPLRLGLSAVLEDIDGQLSYHALHHPAEQPDFHHPNSFTLQLPALS